MYTKYKTEANFQMYIQISRYKKLCRTNYTADHTLVKILPKNLRTSPTMLSRSDMNIKIRILSVRNKEFHVRFIRQSMKFPLINMTKC